MIISKKEMLKFQMINALIKRIPSYRESVLLNGNAHLENTGKAYRLVLTEKNNLAIEYNGEIRLDFGGKLKNWNEKIKDIPN